MRSSKKLRTSLLALAQAVGVLSTSALAAWPVYGGNDNHNAGVSSAPTSSTTTKVAQANLLNSGSGWDGVDTVPVMETAADGNTYAYVLYDGHSAGAHLLKINCNVAITKAGTSSVYDDAKVWDVQLESSSGFQLSTPVLYNGKVYAATNSGSVYAVDTTTGAVDSVVSVTTGQINTPLTIYDGYLYFGTWVGNGTIEGSTDPGRYYQVNLSNHKDIQSVSSIERGFYWAGAVSDGTNVYFGGDDGYLYYRPLGADFGTTDDADIMDSSLELPDGAGNVRSTIMMDGSYLYFTTQGDYLWCCTIGSDGVPSISWNVSLGGTSTSTPTKVGNRIYVGYYSGFSAGGVKCVSTTAGHAVTAVASGFPVQSSIVVKGTGTGTDYLYFNTNSGTTTLEEYGCGYCYSYSGGTSGTRVWKTANDTYALGGMAIENGYAVFGNDYNHLYVVHD